MQAPTLTTKDLILRPSAAADLQTFSEWERIPAVTEFFSIRDGQTLEEVTEKFQKDDADPGAAPDQILRTVRRAVDGFVKDEEQFDDLTMLCLEYKGKAPQKA